MLEIIAEKENLGAAVSITEPGKDADGVWGAATDTKREKRPTQVTWNFASPFGAETNNSEVEAESVLLFR